MESKWIRPQQIYILPTLHGVLFLIMIVIMILVGASSTNNLVYILAFVLFAVYVLTMLNTHNNLKALKYDLVAAEDAFAGETAQFKILVENNTGKDRHFFKAEFRNRVPNSVAPTPLQCVVSGGREVLDLALHTPTRGVYDLPFLVVSSVYPLGLFRAWTYILFVRQFYVYPARSGEAVIKPLAVGRGLGQKVSPTSDSQHQDFHEHRRYTAGQPYHHIDWKAYARTGNLLSKSYQSTSPEYFSLRFQELQGLPIEAALSQLSSWIDQLNTQDAFFELVLPNKRLLYSRGRNHSQVCLRELASFSGGAA